LLILLCKGCGTTATVDCACPPELADLPVHGGECLLNDPDSAHDCACCDGAGHDGQSHGAAAAACPGGHGACPAPDTCEVWAGVTANTRHPLYDGPPPGPCPGGHCGLGVDGCAVCRPLTIIAPAGSAAITMAKAG